MAGRYEILEHPSDVGVAASGETLEEAFALAAEGMMSVVVDPATVDPREWRRVDLPPMDEERLLVRWLGEVLYLYDAGGFVPVRFRVGAASAAGLSAEAGGEPAADDRHSFRLDVKAVTYHGVSVRRSPRGCEVRVFLDI